MQSPAADKLIPATLEFGGKSADIIFDDCDIDSAVDGVQLGILFNKKPYRNSDLASENQ